MKKILSITLALVLSFLLLGSTTVEATTIKLNKTKVTINVGKTYSLKITGTNKTVKWTTSNKSIATVSSKGVVKGVKAGSATITATVSSKKYTCKVTVKEVFNAKKAIQKLSAEDFSKGKGVVQIVKNNYLFPMQLEATMVYYDSDDMMIGKSNARNYYFEKGRESVLFFYAPHDSDYNNVPYSYYKIKYSASPIQNMKSNVKDIEIKSNIGTDNVMVEVKNNGKIAVEFTDIHILYYKDGEIVSYDYQYADVQEPGDTDYLEFSFPWDENYDTIQVDDYKLYINSSYGYK